MPLWHFYRLLHACDDGSPIFVARVTLGEFVVVVPRQHALQVCNNRALLVGIGSGREQELRARVLGVRFRRRLAGDQQLLPSITVPGEKGEGIGAHSIGETYGSAVFDLH